MRNSKSRSSVRLILGGIVLAILAAIIVAWIVNPAVAFNAMVYLAELAFVALLAASVFVGITNLKRILVHYCDLKSCSRSDCRHLG